MTKVVKFNIGGQSYKVSRSLLQMHPDSMLAKSASKQWQEDPNTEIFIDRNGFRFQYVLDYLRHGSVTLPITESREQLCMELEYYNIDANQEDIDKETVMRVPVTDIKRTSLVGKDLSCEHGDEKWHTSVWLSDGRIVGIPANARHVVIYDPRNQSITMIGGTLGYGKNKWWARFIYACPYWSETAMIKIDV